MSFACTSTYFHNDATIIGIFDEKEYNRFFEFSHNDDDFEFAKEFPHKIWVSNSYLPNEQSYRYGIVKKTVAYIAVDEDDYGKPVMEKWNIKNHSIYKRNPNPEGCAFNY